MVESFPRLACLALLLLPRTALAPERSPQSEEGQQVFPLRGYVSKPSAVESLFVAVDAEQDRWATEAVTEALDKRLHLLEAALQDHRPEAIASLVDAEFRGASLTPVSSKPVGAPPGVRLYRFRYEDELSVAAALAPSEFLSWVQDFNSFSAFKFKIVSIEVGVPSGCCSGPGTDSCLVRPGGARGAERDRCSFRLVATRLGPCRWRLENEAPQA